LASSCGEWFLLPLPFFPVLLAHLRDKHEVRVGNLLVV
jgi:hypothetical protein